MATSEETKKRTRRKRGPTVYNTGPPVKHQLRRGRPPSEVDRMKMNFRLPRQLVADLKGEAEHRNLGYSELLAMILIDFFAGRTIRKPREKDTAAKTVAEYAKEKGVVL